MTQLKDETLQKLQASLYRRLPLYEHIGLTILEAGNRNRFRVPLNERNKNHFGSVHAALQWAVAEAVGGVAGTTLTALKNSGEYFLVVKQVTIDFLKPAMTDVDALVIITDEQIATIDQDLKEHGKVEWELNCDITNSTGEIVAKTNATYYASKKR